MKRILITDINGLVGTNFINENLRSFCPIGNISYEQEQLIVKEDVESGSEN